jgi:SAM-dependent methyltransferase
VTETATDRRVTDLPALLAEQQEYYNKRTDYGPWIDHYMGPLKDDVAALLRDRVGRVDEVLELAPGTGWLTGLLAPLASHIDAVDGSAEMLAALRARGLRNLTGHHADLFTWSPVRRWPVIGFSNLLAHVPRSMLPQFLGRIDQALAAGGRVVALDVTPVERVIEEAWWSEGDTDVVRRRLPDGTAYRVVKHYWTPDELLAEIQPHGWTGRATLIGNTIGRGIALYDLRRAADAH